jgi:Ribosomal protein S2
MNFLLLGRRGQLCVFNLNITVFLLKLTFNFLFNLYFQKGLLWVVENINFYKLLNLFLKHINKKNSYKNPDLYKITLSSLYLKIFFFRGIWTFGILSNYRNVSTKLLLKIHQFLLSKQYTKYNVVVNLLSKFFFHKKYTILHKHYKNFSIPSNMFKQKLNTNFIHYDVFTKYSAINKIIFPYPAAVFSSEYSSNELKIKETNRVLIPSISISSSNANSLLSTYILPGNESGFKTNYFFYKLILIFFIRNMYYNILLFKRQILIKLGVMAI